ncbi:hypothetical protein AAMO2058_000711100 [Amorphochlora amoebiformis]
MKKGARHCRVLSFRAQRSVCFVRIETEILTQTTKAMQPRNSAEKLNSTSTRQRRLLDATVQEHPTLAYHPLTDDSPLASLGVEAT